MDYKDKELVQYYFDQLKKLAKKDHCIFIKFDPAIHVNDYDSFLILKETNRRTNPSILG